LVDAKRKKPGDIFEAIKKGRFKNFSLPLQRTDILKAQIFLTMHSYFGGRLRDITANFKNGLLVKKNN